MRPFLLYQNHVIKNFAVVSECLYEEDYRTWDFPSKTVPKINPSSKTDLDFPDNLGWHNLTLYQDFIRQF